MSFVSVDEMGYVSSGTALTSTQHMEQLAMLNYSHLIEIDDSNRRLVIQRIYDDGRKELFTEIKLPSKTCAEDESGFAEFARLLGENLLIDSPIARKLLGL
jgi:hypothetical protein